MGWSTGWQDWKSLERDLVDYGGRRIIVAKKLVNLRHFWSVVEDVITKERFIRLDLIRTVRSDFGYKDLCESMHPYVYDCPLEFLDLVPQVASEEWRKGVQEYQAKRKITYNIGQEVNLVGCKIPKVTIISTKPLRGEYNGIIYSISKKLIGTIERDAYEKK